jgi:uncharacterized protein with von Willebrand factor type A (vWA) domain
MKFLFKPKTIINTDSYDRRVYGQLRADSPRLAELEQKGSEQLPTFPHLMGDMWAGLYKNAPRLKPLGCVPAEVKPNHPIMEKIFAHQEFAGLREHTRLDELASALGVVHLGRKIDELLKDILPENAQKQLQKLARAQNLAQQTRDRADALKDALEYLKDQEDKDQNAAKKMAELKKQLASVQRKAATAQKTLDHLADKAGQEISRALDSPAGETALGQVLAQTQQEVSKDAQAITTFFSGLSAGKQPGEKISMNPATAIQLAELIRNNDKLAKIAGLAGRMKQIAQKKQKSKTRSTVERTNISLGNDPERILAQELALLSKAETRQDTLRRYAEGKMLQYSPEAKERLGKGPVVCCLDTSSSMRSKDAESKAVMLALLGIARKQKRAFALINFSSAGELKCWEFSNPKDIKPEKIVEMAEFFFDGGTDFESPLNRAVEIIKSSRYKKADVVFITDGEDRVSLAWLESFQRAKREKKFQVISVQLGDGTTSTLSKFSDRVIKAVSLFDESVTDAVLAI